jgi:mycofactocin system glycosyltransferase
MLQRRYLLSPRSRLLAAGGTYRLDCTHPLQSIALNESAWRLLHALVDGEPLHRVATGVSAETVRFLEQFVLRGALRADYRLVPAAQPPALEVVIPAYGAARGTAPALARCLEALAGQFHPPERLRVTVVDDASAEPLERATAVPRGLALRWLRLPRNVGPASARNAGVRMPWPDADGADGAPPAPLLAFVDADCVPAPGWLAALAALLEDPTLDAAGGAVRGWSRAGLLARYEDACSSLYLGPAAGPVGLPGGALAYLPSCNLGLRREAFLAVGGFREGWRFGEDVDLCWRLHAAGRDLFYHPDAAVAHDHRTRWGPFLQRRRAYARSEAALRQAHPERFAPLWRPGPAGVTLGAALGLWSGGASGTAAGGALAAACALAMALRPAWEQWRHGARGAFPPGTIALAGARRAAAQTLHQARRLNRQAAMALPVAVLLAPALWPLAGAIAGLGAWAEWLARRPAVRPGTFLAGYGAECLAYSLGRLEGALALGWRRLRGRLAPADPADPP